MTTFISYSTVGAVRQRLASLGMEASGAEIQSVRQIRSDEQIRVALARADTHAPSRNFLATSLAKVRAASGSLFSPAPPPEHLPKPIPVAIGERRSVSVLQRQPSVSTLPTIPRAPDSRLSMVRHGMHSSLVPTLATPERCHEFHIYGATAALTVTAGRNRNGDAVLFIDAAPATSPRYFDWTRKLRLMLTPNEIIVALAVAIGDLPSATFKHHGTAKDKWVELKHQASHLFIKIAQGQTVHAVPVGPADTFKLAALLTAQIQSNVPAAAQAGVIALVRTTVAKMLNAVNASGDAPAAEECGETGR